MARETADYRDELEEILRVFPNKHMLTISDVSRYTGKSRKWLREKEPFKSKFTPAGMSAVSLAKIIQAAK